MIFDEATTNAMNRRLKAAGKKGMLNLEPGNKQMISYANIDVIWHNAGGKCILHQIKHEGEVVYEAPETWDVENICYIR